MWGRLRCPGDAVSQRQGVPGSHAGLCVRARVCACALAGPGFVCFPPNWLVFPCPAHQTACFSSHLASPPGLEPPACMRLARGPERRRDRQPTPLASPDQAGQGRTLPAPALPSPTHTPPAWHSRAIACPNLILWHPLIDPKFWTPKCSPSPHLPQAALSFPANRAEGKVVLNQGVWSFHPVQSNTNVKKLDKELSDLKLVDYSLICFSLKTE